MANTSASIVTYNTPEDELLQCITSLQADGVEPIYISDNSPSDGLRHVCAPLSGVIYIYNGANLGYGAAHNVAIRRAMQAGTPYHLVVNSDVYFQPGVMPALTGYLNANPDVAQVQPRLLYPDGTLLPSVRLLPTPADLILRRFLPKSWCRKSRARYLLAGWDHRSPLNIAYHQGSFMLFRTSAFSSVGLFDERYFMYPEDIDITRRMHRQFRTMYWPHVSVVHAHRAASYKSLRMLMVHIINMVRYFNKWGWICDPERSRFNAETVSNIEVLNNAARPK